MQFYSYGSIVVVDAVTMLRKKVFRFEDLLFQKPEGSLDSLDMLPLNTPLENLAVIDEHSLFLADGQGMFRPDTETGVLTLVKGGYHFGNQGQTIETVVATRGMTVIGDRLYCAGGGFWVETQLFEFTKRRDEVTCSLPLSGEFISGICRTGDHEIVVGTCGRTGETKSYLTFIDTETMTQTRKKSINADISADLMTLSGIKLAGDYLCFAAGTLAVSRVSLTTWQVEEYTRPGRPPRSPLSDLQRGGRSGADAALRLGFGRSERGAHGQWQPPGLRLQRRQATPFPDGGGRRGFFVCRPAGVYSSTRLRGWIICSGLSTLSSSSWLISLCSSTSS